MSVKLRRKTATPIDGLFSELLGQEGNKRLISGLGHHIIYKAWDEISGAKAYTINRYFKAGKLYISLNSSMYRTSLNFQKESIRKEINEYLTKDEIFSKISNNQEVIKELIIK